MSNDVFELRKFTGHIFACCCFCNSFFLYILLIAWSFIYLFCIILAGDADAAGNSLQRIAEDPEGEEREDEDTAQEAPAASPAADPAASATEGHTAAAAGEEQTAATETPVEAPAE